MDIYPAQVTERDELPKVSLPRALGTLNISKLSQSPPANDHPISSSEASTVNSQVLYMKGNGKPRRSALSSIGNDAVVFSEDEKPYLETTLKDKEAGWSIVDQEIFEWQYHCQTGQPYWHTDGVYRPRARYPTSVWVNERKSYTIRTEGDLKVDLDISQQAVSEASEENEEAQDELARLAAIQLLGSCYTLPITHSVVTPESAVFGDTVVPVPDHRLISSLRMHSQFRYSPCFGHQARNVSPVPIWSSNLDGASSIMLHEQAATEEESSNENREPFTSERRRFRDRVPIFYRRTSGGFQPRRNTFSVFSKNGREHWQSENQVHGKDSVGQDELADFAAILLGTGKGAGTLGVAEVNHVEVAPQARFRSAIRSEPHAFLTNPVPMKPVRQLVARRWKTFAKRVGSVRTKDQSLLGSEDAPSSFPSPVLSESGKERRRRAQQESEIDGSSIEDFPILTSPASYRNSSATSDHGTTQSSDSEDVTPRVQQTDPFASAAKAFDAMTDTCNQSGKVDDNRLQSPAVEAQNYGIPAVEDRISRKRGLSSPPRLRQSSPPRSRSLRRGGSQTRRKSLLSEVYTPEDDHQDRVGKWTAGNLNLGGTALPTSIEEVKTPSPTRNPSEWLEPIPLHPCSTADGKDTDRPGAIRMSTTGTEIYRPA